MHLACVDCDPDPNPDSGPGARVNTPIERLSLFRCISNGGFVTTVCPIESVLSLDRGCPFVVGGIYSKGPVLLISSADMINPPGQIEDPIMPT